MSGHPKNLPLAYVEGAVAPTLVFYGRYGEIGQAGELRVDEAPYQFNVNGRLFGLHGLAANSDSGWFFRVLCG